MLASETLPGIVKAHASGQPDKPAVISGGEKTSYSRLWGMAESVASFLAHHGVGRGDCVILSAAMRAEYIAAFLAVKSLRAVAVPASRSATPSEAGGIAGRVKAKIFLTDNPAYRDIPGVLSLSEAAGYPRGEAPSQSAEEIPDAEITEILFTSGTTGRPKGAMLSQLAVASSIVNTAKGVGMRADDVLLLPLPLNHSYGLRVMRSALYLGGTLVLQNGFSFARETVRNITEHHCTCAAMVHAGFELLRQQTGGRWREYLSGLRYIEFSAGSVPESVRRELRASLPGVRLHNTWGSTETGGALFIDFSCCDDERMRSAGHPADGITAEVHGGRLALRGDCLLSGYYDDDELTAAALHGGLLLTNDLAEIDAEGWVYLHGRADDIISVGGEKVSPYDVERTISGLAGIRECACVGVDDDVLGQRPALVVVPEGAGYDIREIEAAIRSKGNPAMIPAEYVNVQAIPRNEMGKVDRKKLRALIKPKAETAPGNFADKFIDVMLTRRSVRTFTDREIPREMLDRILLAGRMAPTGHNSQTWRFTVITKADTIARIRETAKKVAAEKRTLFYGFNNPRALVIISNDRRNPDGIMDSSAAAENILLASHALGLGACWISALRFISDEPEIQAELDSLGIPPTHVAYVCVGIGWASSVPDTPVKRENVVFFADE
ncbi:MAG: AMP-binding protein [Synergistaceae bacterium]|nr:AMP-binding protein [Synergistaceae bacterium]